MFLYLALIDCEEDRDKFELIYKEYKKTMFYVAKGILQNDHNAEDAVSLSFIKIIKHLDKINEVNCHKTKGLIVIIVKNTSIDLYRKIKKEREHIHSIEEKDELFENIEFEVENSVQEAILKLPSKYRDIFFLRYCHQLEYDEISKFLDIKESTIRSLVSRGKKKLEFILRDMKVI
ncbi:MAG: RNA polymerase sigma factor [Peptostreptococcaceae bacterium]